MTDLDPSNERVATGVPHLDRILGGGLLRGSLVLVIGAPGTGKTVLCQQVLFHHAAQGGAVLYLTAFSEMHDKLLRHTRGLAFFRADLIGTQVQLVSLVGLLHAGMDATADAIVALARAHHATLVVLDGFNGMRNLLPDPTAAARFLYSLGAQLALLGATTLVAAEGDVETPARYSEITVCDVIVALTQDADDLAQRRSLRVVKARGSAPLRGSHPFVIGADGFTVYPRLEALAGALQPTWSGERAALGSPALDALMGGGPHVGTSTLVVGTPGAGKTLLGLHFAADGARRQEPTLIVSFVESPAQLEALGGAFGLPLVAAQAQGVLRILALPSYDQDADAVAQLIFHDIERRGVRRLVIDSVTEIEQMISDAQRRPGFMAALVRSLRHQQVTTYFTLEIGTIVGSELSLGGRAVSMVAENAVLLRDVEYRGRLHRVVSVLKMRFSAHDLALHEYALDPRLGLHLLGPAPRADGLLTGNARGFEEPAPPSSPPERTDRP